jgi:hypothetical protein
MTPRQRKHRDLAATITKWATVAGVVLALFKGQHDGVTKTEATATSVVAIQKDIARLSKLAAQVPPIARDVRRIKRQLRLPEGPPMPEAQEAPRTGLVQAVGGLLGGLRNLVFGGNR